MLRLTLPLLVPRLGLHPEYEGQRYLLPEKRALIITTSHSTLGSSGDPTGVFGSELTAPFYEFTDGRMEVDLASIRGGVIPIDPSSFHWLIKTQYDDRSLLDPIFQDKAAHSLRIEDVDMDSYDIIFLAGGWGAAYDLGVSSALGYPRTGTPSIAWPLSRGEGEAIVRY